MEKSKKKTPFMLIGDTHKIFGNHMRMVVDQNNLNGCYRPIIFSLIHHDGLTQLEIVQKTHYKAPTISLTLQKMELEGYVTRQQDANDMRQVRVYLTDKGREYDEKMVKLIKESEKVALASLSEEEITTLERILTKLNYKMAQEFGVKFYEDI